MSDELRRLVAVKPLDFPRVAAGGAAGALVLLGFVGLVLQAMEKV